MPSLNDFAEQYADYLAKQYQSPTVVEDVAQKIKGLSYTKSGNPLSDQDIDKIIDTIEHYFISKRDASEGGMITEAEDSSKFIEMVKLIRQEAKKK